MNSYLKRIFLGLLIWVIPFIASILVWNKDTNEPAIGMPWFNTLMAVTWTAAIAIALYVYFKDATTDTKDGLVTGVIWYVMQLALDLAILVGVFGMALVEYYPIAVAYLNTIILCGVVGYLKK